MAGELEKLINPPVEDVEWIPEEVISDLKGGGIVTLLDLALVPLGFLLRRGLSREDALVLMEKASEGFSYMKQGTRVIDEGRHRRRISTGSLSLDKLLGGGVSSGRVTEFYGESGVGKTQLCFQLCVNAQLASEDKGRDIVFVDTVGTFRPERIAEISEGRIEEDSLFRHIFLVKARSSAEQVKIPRSMNSLPSSDGIGMLIIDTLTDSFVYEFQGDRHIGDRQVALARHLHELAVTAIDRDVAVVVTNTVRTRLSGGRGKYDTETGGNTVSQGVHVRVRLERVFGGWAARLGDDVLSARFKIGKRGIMDWGV